jgi:hypothetical protein
MLSHSRRPNHDNTLRTFNLTESHSSKFLWLLYTHNP